ncbi:MAG: hypothetical protein LC746_06325 [Acidobacteria bacterium]|nr:hypothetical protein [Acidobacteriota bacterium]
MFEHGVVSRKGFRLLLVASWVLAFVAVIAHFVTQRSLPPELQSWLYAYHHSPQYQPSPGRTILLLLCLVAGFANSVGLFAFKRWAKYSLIPVTIFGYLVVGVSRITLDVAWVVSLKSVLSILFGVTISLAFFSPLSKEFDEPERQ